MSLQMDVSTLVSQMHETLSTIHSTLASLDTESHDARLDELERQRDTSLETLRKAFEQEAGTLAQKRKVGLEEIAERRKKEDEERDRRRRLEDEQIAERARKEDEERRVQLQKETQDVEEGADDLMNEVEEGATRLLEEGRERLRVLEERRKEINRLIDEQLKAPLPSAPSRRRTMRPISAARPPFVAPESKISVPNTADEQVGNTAVKAPDEELEDHNPGPETQSRTGEALNSHSQLETSSSTRTDSDMSWSESSNAGEVTERAALEAPDLGQEDAVPSGSRSTDKQATIDGNTEDMEEGKIPDARPRLILGSWGETLRGLVGGVSNSEDSKASDGLPTDLAEKEEVGEDASMLTASGDRSSPKAGTDNETDALQSSNSGGGDRHSEDAILNDFSGDDGYYPPTPHTGLGSPAEQADDNGGHASALMDEDMHVSSSESSDDHFAMTGREAIPGTITHGSDLSRSEIIEPIPGTMTHGVDRVSPGSGSPVEEPTPIVEQGGYEAVSDPAPVTDKVNTAREVLQDGTIPCHNSDTFSDRSQVEVSDIADGGPHLSPDVVTHQYQKSEPGDGGDVDTGVEDDMLSEADSGDASSSQDDSVEVDSSANTSRASVPPARMQVPLDKEGDGTHNAAAAPPEPEYGASNLEHSGEAPPFPAPRMPGASVNDDLESTAKTEIRSREANENHETDEHTKRDGGTELPQEELDTAVEDGSVAFGCESTGQETDDSIPVSNHSCPQSSSTYAEQLELDDDRRLPDQNNRDTESQASMTPLASADFHTPMQFQVSQPYDMYDLEDGDSPYETEEQLAVTMHGQDDLFDDDGRSENASVESGDNPDSKATQEYLNSNRNGTPVREHLDDTSQDGGDDNVWVAGPHALPTPQMSPATTQLEDVTPTATKGLAHSRHNPGRPHTPEQQVRRVSQSGDTESGVFAPVDVTNMPWHARKDSTPRSMHSQSTLSSSPSSPIHSSLPADNHEPVIRDSWPTPTHDRLLLLSGMGRPRNDSQLSSNGDFEPFRYDAKAEASPWQQRETAGHHGPSANEQRMPHRNSVVSSSPGGLFQKMRSIFEPAGGTAGSPTSLSPSGRNSPLWTRPTNGAPRTGSRKTSGAPDTPTKHAAGDVTRDGDGYDSASDRRGGGFLSEPTAEDEADERSSLLANAYNEGMTAN